MTAPKWVSGPHPRKWLYKKEMPPALRPEAYRVDFGLHGVAYISRDACGNVLMLDGRRMPTFDFYLSTPGHVIGPKDLQAAQHLPWAFEWQTVCGDAMMNVVRLHCATGGPH